MISLKALVTGRNDKPTMLMQSAPTINGFSGGALYRKVGEKYHYIGMNTVVAGYRNAAVVFMGGAVPVDLVKDFIGSNL
jgi:S1-C subfamily serine protease